eukprot:8631519-Alexandrium_andersonii.AAC.1
MRSGTSGHLLASTARRSAAPLRASELLPRQPLQHLNYLYKRAECGRLRFWSRIVETATPGCR